jgi:hypothetical protein
MKVAARVGLLRTMDKEALSLGLLAKTKLDFQVMEFIDCHLGLDFFSMEVGVISRFLFSLKRNAN